MASRLILNSFRPAFSSTPIVRNFSNQAMMDQRAQSAARNALVQTDTASLSRSCISPKKSTAAEALCEKGLEMLDTQEYQEAMRLFKQAHALDPNPSYQHYANMAEMGASGSLPSF